MDIEYTVVRSGRRTIAAEVTADARVIVRAPRRVSQREIAAFVAMHEGWIVEHSLRARERRAAHPEPTGEREAELRARAKSVLPGRVAYYAGVMGVTPTSLRITSARTRFGSCNAANGVCFSWRLMDYPDEAVDYVVVHELAHIIEHNHSAAFWRVVAGVMPDHKRRRAMLG